MLNRRHLRIKVLQTLYAYFQTNEDDYVKTEQAMIATVDKIYELYLLLLLSFGELKSVAENRIEDAKAKIRPSEEEKNPNRKFVDNKVIGILENSKELRSASESRKVNWVGDVNREMFKKMHASIRESEIYFEHMNNDVEGYEEDLAFAIAIFKEEIANSPLMLNFFEEKNIQWIDDIDLVCSMVIKTLKSFSEDGKNELLPLYKDPVDEKQFISTLLRKSIMRNDENMKLIDELTDNWELDRIAKMDLILMNMAITELLEFQNIPKKVTLNEYIEISKFYSTPKSNTFINGILDKAIDRLEKEKKIKKVGRGLLN